jgi:hypothetical protein
MRWVWSSVLRSRRYAVILTVAAAILALAPSVCANVLTVDCSGATPGTFTNIQAAIDSLPVNSSTEPHTIIVTGTCAPVSIESRQRISIEAPVGQTATIASANPNATLVSIGRSRSIDFRRFVFSGGGIGLFLNQNSEATIEDLTIENTRRGILMLQNSSLATAGNTHIRNNSSHGIELDEGSVIVLGQATIENNIGNGILLGNGSRATISNTTMTGNRSGVIVFQGSAARFAVQNTIQNNSFSGVQVRDGSAVVFDGETILDGNPQNGLGILASKVEVRGTLKVRNNGSTTFPLHNGIGVDAGGTLVLGNAAEISGNTGPGIHVRGNSVVYLSSGFPILIQNNTEEGIRVGRLALVTIFLPVTITNNPAGSITCDKTSLLSGTIANLTEVKCKNIGPAE